MGELTRDASSWPIVVFALAVTFTACKTEPHRDSNTIQIAGQPTDFYFTPDCGPMGGGALSFHLAMSGSVVKDRPIPFVSIRISDGILDLGPREYQIKPGNYDTMASRCLDEKRCEAATSGSLWLAVYKPGAAASGMYTLTFKDGTVERASFGVGHRDEPADKQPLGCW